MDSCYVDMTAHTGFPHSEIHGSMLAYSSPWLIAVNHVLLRLLVPRHSPCALISLIFVYFSDSPYNYCMSFSAFEIADFGLSYITYVFFLLNVFFSPRITFYMQFSRCLVGSSGLEPPTSRLSGVRSNQLSYEPAFLTRSTPTPSFQMVEVNGFEPMTPCLQSRCSTS